MSEQMTISEQHDKSFDEFKKDALQLIESANETKGIIILVIEPQDENHIKATINANASIADFAIAVQTLTKEADALTLACAASLS
jgi:hypothetical protein